MLKVLIAAVLIAGISNASAADNYGACTIDMKKLLSYGGMATKVTEISNDRPGLKVTYTYQPEKASSSYKITVPYDLDDELGGQDKQEAVDTIHTSMDEEASAVKAGELWYVVSNLMANAEPGDPIAYKGLDGSKFAWTVWKQYVVYTTTQEGGAHCESAPLGEFVYKDVLPPEVLNSLQ